jgi:hypothetical protein
VAGKAFTVDLCTQHFTELRKAVDPFAKAAGVSSRPRRSGSGRARSAGSTSSFLVVADLTEDEKAFAREQGWKGKRLSKELSESIRMRRASAGR